MIIEENTGQSSQLQTVSKAAQIIGVQYRQLLDAVNTNLIPHYKIGHSRRLVNISEVIAIMKTDGGQNV
jgi:hypothetical protein